MFCHLFLVVAMTQGKRTALRSIDELMRELVALKNDPELVEEFYLYAIQGNADAQYGLGLIYAEGRGTEEDLVKSYAWLTLCENSGDEDATVLRHIVAEGMSKQDVEASDKYTDELKKTIAENKVTFLK